MGITNAKMASKFTDATMQLVNVVTMCTVIVGTLSTKNILENDTWNHKKLP
jgi:hypothetical protein